MKKSIITKVQRLVLEQNPITGSQYYLKDFYEVTTTENNINEKQNHLLGGENFIYDSNLTVVFNKKKNLDNLNL